MPPGARPELRLPFRPTSPPISFVHLAEAAGLGRRGLLGVLVHPEFGPWMALCGALLVDALPRASDNPCLDRCHARMACVYGRQHHYPPDALAYHQQRAFAVMRKHR